MLDLMTKKTASLSYAQLPDLVRLNILKFLSYSELLELHRSDSQFHDDVWYVVRKRVLNEPYELMIDVKEESWDRSMEGGYERDILSSEYYLGFRMHTPIICKETLHIDFQIKINNCSNAHESHSAFEEYHKDVVVPLDYGHDLQLTMIVAALGDVASSISHHWLQSEELCHYPIDQALSKGVQSDHICLSFSPTKAQIHYTAYWDDSNSAKTYCHEHLIKDDGDLVMVQCDKFHCSLLWWEQAITSAEKYIPTKKIRDEESLRTPISKEQNNKSI